MALSHPTILKEGAYTEKELDAFLSSVPVWRAQDIYLAQLREYFEITYPTLAGTPEFTTAFQAYAAESTAGRERTAGNWVYYPWSGQLVHTLSEKEYFLLRTNRNRNLVTLEEQAILYNSCVAFAGLSVGSNVATTLAYHGVAKQMKLADFDLLETSNLNRIRARLDQIGQPKTEIVARQLYEVDPYLEITAMDTGVTKDQLEEFVCADPVPRVIFEIIDSFEMKIHLRALARQKRIPVVMVTNLGDSVILDVERYDLNPEQEFFNGRAGTIPQEMVDNPDVTTADKHRYAVALAGKNNIPERALQSVDEIGKTLVGRPQLATTVGTAAGLCGYIARKIILNEELPSVSRQIRFDDIFQSSIHTV